MRQADISWLKQLQNKFHLTCIQTQATIEIPPLIATQNQIHQTIILQKIQLQMIQISSIILWQKKMFEPEFLIYLFFLIHARRNKNEENLLRLEEAETTNSL